MPRDRDSVAHELLAVRCRRGDRAALEELVDTYESRLLYFLRRLLPQEEDAWDVLQKTWLRVLAGIGRLDDPKRLVPWLYRIARNAAYSHARLKDDVREPKDVFVEAEDASEFENAELVHLGLAKLSREHREVLTLVFLEDLGVDEVAAVLGVPSGTVKSRLHYARRALRHAIEGPGAP